MNSKKFALVASLICGLASAFGTRQQVHAQNDKNSYVKMAPVEQYLMDRDAEIALARSAARRPMRNSYLKTPNGRVARHPGAISITSHKPTSQG